MKFSERILVEVINKDDRGEPSYLTTDRDCMNWFVSFLYCKTLTVRHYVNDDGIKMSRYTCKSCWIYIFPFILQDIKETRLNKGEDFNLLHHLFYSSDIYEVLKILWIVISILTLIKVWS